ncbi:MAG TPA: hypothetical protein VHB21_19440 [Minicystis sp.]|nr:hypothetical protein [Minicystis sp.]
MARFEGAIAPFAYPTLGLAVDASPKVAVGGNAVRARLLHALPGAVGAADADEARADLDAIRDASCVVGRPREARGPNRHASRATTSGGRCPHRWRQGTRPARRSTASVRHQATPKSKLLGRSGRALSRGAMRAQCATAMTVGSSLAEWATVDASNVGLGAGAGGSALGFSWSSRALQRSGLPRFGAAPFGAWA